MRVCMLSIYLSLYLSLYLSRFLSFYLSIFLSIFLSIYLSFYLSISPASPFYINLFFGLSSYFILINLYLPTSSYTSLNLSMQIHVYFFFPNLSISNYTNLNLFISTYFNLYLSISNYFSLTLSMYIDIYLYSSNSIYIKLG